MSLPLPPHFSPVCGVFAIAPLSPLLLHFVFLTCRWVGCPDRL